MASIQPLKKFDVLRNVEQEKEDRSKSIERYKEIIATLPKHHELPYRQYQGFWFYPPMLEKLMDAQDHFKAQPSDIFLCSFPKSGTTWLKSLAFCIATRSHYKDDNSANPLLTKSPHELISNLEQRHVSCCDPLLPIMATHFAYTCLPASIRASGSKIVYICRDPKDVVVSFYYFVKKIPASGEATNIEEIFERFCTGSDVWGPYWDHVLSYWKASLEDPENVLFLKFEEMKNDTVTHVKRLAEFMGYPFLQEEESMGEVQKIVEMCSFKNLSNLETNKAGEIVGNLKIKKDSYFRKGEIGDWKNHLSNEMAKRLDKILEEKLTPFGLSLGASTLGA